MAGSRQSQPNRTFGLPTGTSLDPNACIYDRTPRSPHAPGPIPVYDIRSTFNTGLQGDDEGVTYYPGTPFYPSYPHNPSVTSTSPDEAHGLPNCGPVILSVSKVLCD